MLPAVCDKARTLPLVPPSFRCLGESRQRGTDLGTFASDNTAAGEPGRFFREARETRRLSMAGRSCCAFDHLRQHRPKVGREVTHIIDERQRLAGLYDSVGDVAITVVRVGPHS